MNTFSAYDFLDINVLMDNKQYEVAYKQLLEMYSYSKDESSCESPFVMYYLGICQSNLGNIYEAADWGKKAKASDPLNYTYAHFYSSVLGNIENNLTELVPFGAINKNEIEQIYQYLFNCGYVRSSLQFTMIRYYMKINELSIAKEMLTNFLERNPNDLEANKMMKNFNNHGTRTEKVENVKKVKLA